MGDANMTVFKRWLFWMVLPIAFLCVVIDFSPWPGAMETLIFVCLVNIWGFFIARPRLDA